jgi:MutS domain V
VVQSSQSSQSAQPTAAVSEEMTPTLAADTPAELYTARRDVFARQRDDYQRQRLGAANLTVLLFFLPAVFIVLAIGTQSLLWLLGIIPCWIVCGYFFVRQGRLEARFRRFKALAEINDEGLHRLQRDWPAMPLREPPEPPAPLPVFAGDLDLLGHASLQHLLNSASTPAAQQRLTGWLLAPAAPDEIRQRQTAVAELAEVVDFRDELTLFGRLSGMSPYAYQRFLEWAEQGPWLSQRPAIIWTSRILPVLTVGLLALNLAGIVRLPLWLVFLAASIVFSALFGKPVEEVIDQVADRQAVFQPYEGIFARVLHQPFETPRLRQVQRDLAADEVNADAQMHRLGRILQFGDFRLSMFFPIIQAFLLWNFHVLWFLEGWQRTAGHRVRSWLETLSELEALSALATLAADNPTWAFPEIIAKSTEEPVLAARNLGHPLLPPATCVGNEVSIGPLGRFLFVTGSNMSGKSTLLRALGVNVVLAQAGGPVCAESMRLTPLTLATSIRVQDSLENGISYFMAELRRLREVVEIARTTTGTAGTDERQPLFLLDEILHGTNTSERQIAARQIIRTLLRYGATGAVSSHDLSLTETADLTAARDAVHFTENFARGADGPTMSFDYRLRPGVATSANALKLMEMVGLPLDDAADGTTDGSGQQG